MKGFFKILSWFFNLADRISREKRQWEKRGYVFKILSLLLVLLIGAAALGMTFLTFTMIHGLSAKELGKTIVILFGLLFVVAIALGFIMAEYELLIIRTIAIFASLAFKKRQKVEKIIENVSDANEETANSEVVVNEEGPETEIFTQKSETIIEEQKPKTSHTFDVFMAITYLVLTVAFTGGIFFAAYLALSK